MADPRHRQWGPSQAGSEAVVSAGGWAGMGVRGQGGRPPADNISDVQEDLSGQSLVSRDRTGHDEEGRGNGLFQISQDSTGVLVSADCGNGGERKYPINVSFSCHISHQRVGCRRSLDRVKVAMARGHQKIQSQQKNAKKQAEAKKAKGHDQKTAAKAALVFTCGVCKSQMPDPKTFKQHFESKHPKVPLPPELVDVVA
ncbi:hypothetical protein ACEWY4_023672 [Coilia grayii]|uniref:Zinc finger protein 706 n=1 Tax=Coilia grayii TaxID=363190 RepID=A0ABD1IY61_9TELE